nr:peptidase domain-containing ABC transporter [Dyella sp. ASV24]
MRAREHEQRIQDADLAIKSSGAKLSFSRRRRLPVMRQTEAAECGLACLAMIASYHGHHADLAAMRRKFAISMKGVTLARLIEIAHALGLSSRPLKLELSELHQLQLPCLLHWNLNHFVVLKEVRKGRVIIHDPALGERRLSIEDVSHHFTGIAVELMPGSDFKRQEAAPNLPLRALTGSVHGLTRSLVQVFSLALVLELFALLTPQLTQAVVDQVIADGDHELLAMVGISFIVLLMLQTTFTAIRTWTVMWLGSHFNLSWTGNVFQHLVRLPQAYFLKRHLGDVVSRFNAITTIQQTLTTQFIGAILDGLMATLTLVALYIYSPLLATITLLALFLYGVLRLAYFRHFREATMDQIESGAKQQSCFIESVRGIQTLRLYNQESMQTSRYLNATANAINTGIHVQKLGIAFGTLNSLTSGVQRIAVLWIGAWVALRGSFSTGMLIAFTSYADQFTSRAASAIDYLVQLRLLRLQGDRLADIVMSDVERHAEGIYVGPLPNPSIQFRDVSFRYADGEPWLLDKCSFEIRPGEAVAIVGPSGCGKSTLMRLMLGLLDPQEGSISVGGIDLRHLGKSTFRKMAGSVMQDDKLFAGTIADNISFFDESAVPEDIDRAAKLAQLHEDIVAMPMGYHTLVGDMGSTLSGGQQQRLCLARALYRDPSFYFLDEATSHLDSKREMAIVSVFRETKATRVLIAHRSEAIKSADRILMMDHGRLVETSLASYFGE